MGGHLAQNTEVITSEANRDRDRDATGLHAADSKATAQDRQR